MDPKLQHPNYLIPSQVRVKQPRVSYRLAAATQVHTLPFANWWLYMWGIISLCLLAGVFLIPFKWWALATIIGFGSMEFVGIRWGGPHPPLTDVLRAFLPYWLTLLAIGVFMGAASSVWRVWGNGGAHTYRIAVWLGLLLWFIAHFTAKYAP